MEFGAQMHGGESDRVALSATMQPTLGIGVGDAVDGQIEEREQRISALRSRIRRAQERASRYVQPGTLVSDELSAERREAAKHE
jgi:hypothetical protein